MSDKEETESGFCEDRCETMQANKLRVLTLNCWGIPYLTQEWRLRISCIADELSKGHYDIVALQEIWIEKQYQEIKKKVSNVLPYSHYFYSGAIGTGLCVFSKYQLADAFLHQFSANGQFYAISHGDWFAGKGIGYCTVKHPQGVAHLYNLHFPINGDFYAMYYGDWLAGAGLCCCHVHLTHSNTFIHFFAVHLHASYPSNHYKELRTLQAYHSAQFVKKMTRPGDAVILCGDFNHEENEIGIRALKSITGFKDSYRSALCKPEGQCLTCNTNDNPYTSTKEHPARIDFIFHSDRLKCLENGLDLEEVPGTKHHFSDHKGVSATFQFNEALEMESGGEEEDSSTESKMAVLKELHEIVSYGRQLAEEYKWRWIVPIWILLLVFIFMPVFSEDGIYFLLPVFSQLTGEIVFIIQIICIVLSVSYFWSLVILKRIEKNAYLNAMNEIQLKLKMLQRTES